jgi:hypothetical protein
VPIFMHMFITLIAFPSTLTLYRSQHGKVELFRPCLSFRLGAPSLNNYEVHVTAVREETAGSQPEGLKFLSEYLLILRTL